jgi:hypothetical protein
MFEIAVYLFNRPIIINKNYVFSKYILKSFYKKL